MMEGDSTHKKSMLNGQKIALLLFVIIGGFFLWTEHKAHIMGALPYLILLLCPLMHVFMHHGHGKEHGSIHGHQPPKNEGGPP
jgi:hypothetical protein